MESVTGEKSDGNRRGVDCCPSNCRMVMAAPHLSDCLCSIVGRYGRRPLFSERIVAAIDRRRQRRCSRSVEGSVKEDGGAAESSSASRNATASGLAASWSQLPQVPRADAHRRRSRLPPRSLAATLHALRRLQKFLYHPDFASPSSASRPNHQLCDSHSFLLSRHFSI